MTDKESNFIDDLGIIVNDSENEEFEIVDDEEIEELALSYYKQEQIQLEQKKKQLALKFDGERLKQAEQVITSMSMILDRLLDGYDRNVSAQDIKFLAEAYDKMAKSFTNVFRLDSLDEKGTAARISLEINFG